MDSSDGLSKKYRTYTKAQKLSIIADLRKLLWPESNTEDSLSFNNISDRLEQISKIRYNELLERIFSTHVNCYFGNFFDTSIFSHLIF